jgi:hypothetical protein
MSGFVENRSPAFWILSVILGLIVVAILSLTLTPLGKNLLDRFNEQFSEEYIARKSVDYLVATDGLEETLKIIYSDFETPDQIFGPLWLQSVTVDGAKVTLRHQYREAFDDVSDVFVPDDDHFDFCGVPFYEQLLAHGAVFTNAYFDADYTPIGAVTVTAKICGLDLY